MKKDSRLHHVYLTITYWPRYAPVRCTHLFLMLIIKGNRALRAPRPLNLCCPFLHPLVKKQKCSPRRIEPGLTTMTALRNEFSNIEKLSPFRNFRWRENSDFWENSQINDLTLTHEDKLFTGPLHQIPCRRVLNDLQRTRLSRRRKIWLVAELLPLSRQQSCLSFSVLLCVASRACQRQRGGGDGGGAKSHDETRMPGPL